jgi:predicted alpha/beta hydrolase family esterase
MNTIIFLSGIFVPTWLAKSPFIWQASHWFGYNCLWEKSKIPSSDHVVDQELDRLEKLVSQFHKVILAGHSLGAWWVSNLLSRPRVTAVTKSVLWTPLTDANKYFLPVSHHPLDQQPNRQHVGPNRNLVVYASQDLIVPHYDHALELAKHFNSQTYQLDGGHFHQKNHKAGLWFMKEWLES